MLVFPVFKQAGEIIEVRVFPGFYPRLVTPAMAMAKLVVVVVRVIVMKMTMALLLLISSSVMMNILSMVRDQRQGEDKVHRRC